MSTQPLSEKKCQPCEGYTGKMSAADAEKELSQLVGWVSAQGGRCIRKEWVAKDFKSGIEFFNHVAKLAEVEGHHPDLHITDYRKVAIELSTHAVGGLSENDFILAAKIDQIPIVLKTK